MGEGEEKCAPSQLLLFRMVEEEQVDGGAEVAEGEELAARSNRLVVLARENMWVWRTVCQVLMILPFTWMGVMLRLLLSSVRWSHSEDVFPVLFANAVACWLVRWLPILHQGGPMGEGLASALSTGFAGSTSSLSSFVGVLLWHTARVHGLPDLPLLIAGLLAGLAVPLLFYLHAEQTYLAVERRLTVFPASSPPPAAAQTVAMLITAAVLCVISLGFTCVTGPILMLYDEPPVVVVVALVTAPLGTLTRYALAYLNGSLPGRFSRLPLGTFLANVSGTWLLLALDYGREAAGHDSLGGDILLGTVLGFCGCLTTVATFIKEIRALSAHAWSCQVYVSATLAICCLPLLPMWLLYQ